MHRSVSEQTSAFYSLRPKGHYNVIYHERPDRTYLLQKGANVLSCWQIWTPDYTICWIINTDTFITTDLTKCASVGIVRYWLGAGCGDFAISSKNCLGTSFYCLMATMPDGSPTYHPGNDYLRGRRVKMSSIPIKDPYFATLKSVNYLPNALAAMDGEQHGMDCVSTSFWSTVILMMLPLFCTCVTHSWFIFTKYYCCKS